MSNVISDSTWKGKQSWNRELIEEIAGHRIKYTVKVDAYDFQSYAKVQVWREMEWSTIHTVPGTRLKTAVSYVQDAVKPSAFDADLKELRRVAMAVLDIKL